MEDCVDENLERAITRNSAALPPIFAFLFIKVGLDDSGKNGCYGSLQIDISRRFLTPRHWLHRICPT